MATPSRKSLSMEQFLEVAFGRTTAIKNDKCVLCGGDAKEFRDEVSEREYSISGMCQECQDATYSEE